MILLEKGNRETTQFCESFDIVDYFGKYEVKLPVKPLPEGKNKNTTAVCAVFAEHLLRSF